MKTNGEDVCAACGQLSKSCIRCRAQKRAEPWQPFRQLIAPWLTLLLVATITALMLNA